MNKKHRKERGYTREGGAYFSYILLRIMYVLFILRVVAGIGLIRI